MVKQTKCLCVTDKIMKQIDMMYLLKIYHKYMHEKMDKKYIASTKYQDT